MTEMELDAMCERQTNCGCDCKNCPLFAEYVRTLLNS